MASSYFIFLMYFKFKFVFFLNLFNIELIDNINQYFLHQLCLYNYLTRLLIK